MKKQKYPKSDADILREKAEIQLKKNRANSGSELSESNSLRLIHELNVHQIELEMHNEELTRTHTEEYV